MAWCWQVIGIRWWEIATFKVIVHCSGLSEGGSAPLLRFEPPCCYWKSVLMCIKCVKFPTFIDPPSLSPPDWPGYFNHCCAILCHTVIMLLLDTSGKWLASCVTCHQDWLVTCADVIARVRHQPVKWVTPLGWPVLQPYFRTNKLGDKKKGDHAVTYE